MQAIAETIFDIVYLSTVIILGIIMVNNSGPNKLIKKFGIMAVVLGSGDAFHLIPRSYALWTSGLEANAGLLGIGKLITSITMTIFYMILYYVWRDYYDIKGRDKLTKTLWGLAFARVVLSLLPQNQWLSPRPPVSYGVLRNIPFAIIGLIIIVLFYQESRKNKDKIFWHMPLAVGLSFGFYIPVVLFSSSIPILGALMIPKTLAYVWVVLMGWNLYKNLRAGVIYD